MPEGPAAKGPEFKFELQVKVSRQLTQIKVSSCS